MKRPVIRWIAFTMVLAGIVGGGHPAVEEPEGGALVRLYIQQLTHVSQWV